MLVVDPVDPSGIADKYTGYFGQFNVEPFIIRYRSGHMTRPSNPLPCPHRSLCMDPGFFNFKWNSWVSWYVVSPSTLFSKEIGKAALINFALYTVLNTQFLWWILVVSSTLCGRVDKNLGSDTFL